MVILNERLAEMHSVIGNIVDAKVSEISDMSQSMAGTEAFSLDDAKDIFLGMTGEPCPDGLISLLALPDTVEFAWSVGEVKGEIGLANPLMIWNRGLESSGVVETGSDLNAGKDYVIFDMAVDSGDPFYVLIDRADRSNELLHLFDGREIVPLTITIPQYVDLLVKGCGFYAWQSLFAGQPLGFDRQARIIAALDLLSTVKEPSELAPFCDALEHLRQL